MRTWWKAVVGLLVVAPAAAYVVGSLATSSADEPAPRPPILIQAPASSPSAGPDRSRDDTHDEGGVGGVGEVTIDPDDLDDAQDDWGRDDVHGDDHGNHDRSDRGDDSGSGHGSDDHMDESGSGHGDDSGSDDSGSDDGGSDDGGHGGGGDD